MQRAWNWKADCFQVKRKPESKLKHKKASLGVYVNRVDEEHGESERDGECQTSITNVEYLRKVEAIKAVKLTDQPITVAGKGYMDMVKVSTLTCACLLQNRQARPSVENGCQKFS